MSFLSELRAHPVRQRIIETARSEFFASGFTKVTMDELAHELGMSKRTIYEHFSSKEELLRETLIYQVERIREGLEEIVDESDEDFVTKLFRIFDLYVSELGGPRRKFLDDMRRTAPELWNEIDDMRSRLVREKFMKLFQDGIEQGLVRTDLDPELLILILTAAVRRLIRPDELVKLSYSATEVFEHICSVLTLGIATTRGRQLFLDARDRNLGC